MTSLNNQSFSDDDADFIRSASLVHAASLAHTAVSPVEDPSDDARLLRIWLGSYAQRSPHTRRQAVRESRRLLAFLNHTKGLSRRQLADCSLDDANRFVAYLRSPFPLDPHVLDLRQLKEQPIDGPLAWSSVRLAVRVLHRMFEAMRNVLVQGNPIIKINPLRLVNLPSKKSSPNYEGKALTAAEMDEVLAAIEVMPRDTKRELARYHRIRWVIAVLYRSWIRRSAFAALSMRDFERMSGHWRVKIRTKGGGDEYIVVTDHLINELITYRRSLGMTDLPAADDRRPVFQALGGSVKPMTDQTVYNVVTEFAELVADGVEDPVMSARIRAATPHTFRHTAITHALEAGIDPRYVQAQATHSSLTVTANYDHKDKAKMAGILSKVF